jgi:phospholipid/cholesterol/gamma-HCH transport system substrate-binding protein
VVDDDDPPRIPLKPGLLAKLQERGEEVLERTDEVLGRVNRMLGDENQRRFSTALDNLGTAAADASRLVKRLDTTMAARVDPALAEATVTLRSVRKSADEVQKAAASFERTARRLNEKDGPMDRLAEGTQALSHAADSFNSATLPRINRVTEETSRAVRQLSRAVTAINENPQSLIFGAGPAVAGPGEPGFVAPGAAK